MNCAPPSFRAFGWLRRLATIRTAIAKGAEADALGFIKGGVMDNTRTAALGSIAAAEKKIRELPQALTVGFVVGVCGALLAICAAMRATVDHVDAIE